MMCRDLTNELADFDHQKEQELRAVFLEYASLFCGKFQRVSDEIVVYGDTRFCGYSFRANGLV